MDMELSKKTTILLTPKLYDRLTILAEERHTSLGNLVRVACEKEYGAPSLEEKLAALARIAARNLPVGTPAQMKRESVAAPKKLYDDID
jgi:hypothetical protein